MQLLGAALFLLSALGLVFVAAQLVAALVHLHRARPGATSHRPGISILKPLCGIDDDLAANIEAFAHLDYPDYEVLLGVRDERDPAFDLARRAAARHPGRVRLVRQVGAPGQNPKVNQLVTLARAARHDLLVVSDSNVAVAADYLDEITAALADPRVGVVTHPVAGVGEEGLGSVLDNLHLCGSIGTGMIGAHRVLGQDVVVGKSMALRRRDLARLGGFEAFADVLAEDYLIGQRMTTELRLRVVVARRAIHNVSRRRTVREFLARYCRWSVMHRMAVGPVVYGAAVVLNPLPLALAAPSWRALALASLVAFLRAALDQGAAIALRGHGFRLRHLAVVPLKDLLFAAAWVYGFMNDTVAWRGNRLRVLPGTRLLPRAVSPSVPSLAEPLPGQQVG